MVFLERLSVIKRGEKKIDFLFSFIDNRIKSNNLAMKFAIKRPPPFRGLITSTGFIGRSFLVYGEGR